MSCSSTSETSPVYVVKGEDVTIEIIVRDPSLSTSPDADQRIDMTGTKIYLTVKKRYEDAQALIRKRNTAAGGSDTQAMVVVPQTTTDKGKIRFFITGSVDTAPLETNVPYVIDVWFEDAATSKDHVIIEPRDFIIKPRVTVI